MGWSMSMKIVGIVTIGCGFLCLSVIRNHPHEIGGVTPARMEGKPEKGAASTYTVGQAISITIKNWNVWTIIVFFVIWYGTIMSFQGLWANSWMINVFGMESKTAASVASMIPVGMIFGAPIAGMLSDKVLKSKKKTLILGSTVSILIWIPLIFLRTSPGITVLSVLLFLYGYFNGHFVVIYANMKENVAPEIQGTATGLLNTFVFSGAALHQMLTSAAIQKYTDAAGAIAPAGFQAAFLVCMVPLVVVLAFFLTQKDTAKK
jgi:sugar phosphate permease